VVGQNHSGTQLLLHWNGHRWRLGGMPVRGYHEKAIASSSPSDVWLFGYTTKPVALRWNGRSWHQTSWPGFASFPPQAVTVLAWNDVWISVG
jgi:hypothetical protein